MESGGRLEAKPWIFGTAKMRCGLNASASFPEGGLDGMTQKIFRLCLPIFIPIMLLGGCGSAGPFVTHVYKSADNVLTVEKCMVDNTVFVLSTAECTSQTIELAK